MAQQLRVGILGAGFAADGHFTAFSRLPNVEVAALWNRTRSRAETLARKHPQQSIQIYDSWQQMLESASIDILSVATTEAVRRQPAIAALEMGVHLLVEKPFALNLADALAMATAAESSQSVAAISLDQHYAPGNQAAWRGLREGWIGQVLDIQLGSFLSMTPRAWQESNPWSSERHSILAHMGSHDFDKVRFLTGSEYTRLAGRIRPVTLPNEPEYTMYGTYSLIAEMTDGILAEIRMAPTVGQPEWRALINGTEGTLLVTNEQVLRQRVGEAQPTAMEIHASEEMQDGIRPGQHSWNRLVADFIAAIRRGDRACKTVPHLPTFTDGLRAQEVIATAMRAEHEQRWVNLDEIRLDEGSLY